MTFHHLSVNTHPCCQHCCHTMCWMILQRERTGWGGADWRPVCIMAESLHADWACSLCPGMDVKWTAVEVYKRREQYENRNNRRREPGQRTHTPLLGGSADSTADRPRERSSVSIMVSLQIIYISPLLLCCPQAHKASFSMLLLAKAVRETSSEVYCGWSKVVRTNAYRHTHIPHTTQFRRGRPQNCYSYQNDTCAAFSYSWINATEG